MPKLLHHTIPMGEYEVALVDGLPDSRVLTESRSLAAPTSCKILLIDYYATLREADETIESLPPGRRAAIRIPLGIPALGTADPGIDPDIRTGDWLLGRIAAFAA